MTTVEHKSRVFVIFFTFLKQPKASGLYNQHPTNTMASLNDSCARLAASLAAIDAAKKRTVVLDTIINPKQMKTTTVVKKTIIRTAAPKAAEPKSVEAKVVTPKATATKGVERAAIAPSAPVKPKAKKSSALNKLVKGKKFDFSA